MSASTPESPKRKVLGTAILVAAVIASAWIIVSGIGTPEKRAAAAAETFIREITRMLEENRAKEAREKIRAALEEDPEHAGLHLVMGTCLLKMSLYDAAVEHLEKASELDPGSSATCRVHLGHAFLGMGYASRALPLLEQRVHDSTIEEIRQELLAECYLALERFEDSLTILERKENAGKLAWARHRALRYLGRDEEAMQIIKSTDLRTAARLRAVQAREEGDFDGALDEIVRWSEKDPAWILQFRSAELAIYLEAGRIDPLLRLSRDLTHVAKASIAGRALWYHAMANLLAGRKEEAVKVAKAFLSGMDPEYGPLRLERLMMRHLAGEAETAEVADEASRISRFHANVLYYYMALATGDRKWAEKALESTPGNNFPRHAIRRLLGT